MLVIRKVERSSRHQGLRAWELKFMLHWHHNVVLLQYPQSINVSMNVPFFVESYIGSMYIGSNRIYIGSIYKAGRIFKVWSRGAGRKITIQVFVSFCVYDLCGFGKNKVSGNSLSNVIHVEGLVGPSLAKHVPLLQWAILSHWVELRIVQRRSEDKHVEIWKWI